MSKTTIGKVIEIRESLRALIALDSPQPLALDGKTRYNLLRAFRKAKKAIAEYDETRDGLIKSLGEKQPDGNFNIPPVIKNPARADASLTPEQVKALPEMIQNPAMAKFVEELNTLQAMEVEFEKETFAASIFEDSKQVPLGTVSLLMDLGILTE